MTRKKESLEIIELVKKMLRCSKKESLIKHLQKFFDLYKKDMVLYELDDYEYDNIIEDVMSVFIEKDLSGSIIKEIVNQTFLKKDPLDIALVITLDIISKMNNKDLEALLTESQYNFFERMAELIFQHNETTEKIYELFHDSFSLLSKDLFVWLKYDRTDILKKGLITALKNESNLLAINCIFIQEIYKVFEPQEILLLSESYYISNKISKILENDRYLARNFNEYLNNENYINPKIERIIYSLDANFTIILSIFEEIEYKKNYKIDAFLDFISFIKGTEPLNRNYSLIKAKLNDILNSIKTIDYEYKFERYHLAAFSRLTYTINQTLNYLEDYFIYITKNNNKD